MTTKVKELMTANPVIVSADTTLKEAAQKMEDIDCGVLPVGIRDKLEGMITDRDIVIRAIARGKDVNTEKVRDYMTPEVFYCNAEDTLGNVAEQMRRHQVSRLVVKGADGKPVGIITFGCMLRKDADIQELHEIVDRAVGKRAA